VISAKGKAGLGEHHEGSGFAASTTPCPSPQGQRALPIPPSPSRSDDDNLHLHWVFARRRAPLRRLIILHVDDPLEIAIPKLMKAGRRDEIVGASPPRAPAAPRPSPR